MQRALYQQQTALHLHPANAKAIAECAEETGAEVLRGALCDLNEGSGWQLGDIDLSERLAKYKDCSLLIATDSGPGTALQIGS